MTSPAVGFFSFFSLRYIYVTNTYVFLNSLMFLQEVTSVLNLLGEEFKRTNKCEFTVVKDKFMFHGAGFALAKNSPYTDNFSME